MALNELAAGNVRFHLIAEIVKSRDSVNGDKQKTIRLIIGRPKVEVLRYRAPDPTISLIIHRFSYSEGTDKLTFLLEKW
jgi:hypothetical protein